MSNSPPTLNVTETHSFIDSLLCKDGSRSQFRKGVRNYCIGLLMVEAGLRVGEVTQLIVSDLWLRGLVVPNVVVRAEIAKNKTERIIPVSSRLSIAIYEMDRHVWDPDGAMPFSFAFYADSPFDSITTRQIERIFEKAGKNAIGRSVNPHMLRHTFASRLMRKTNSRIVQELLGHKNLASTQIYTHPNGDDLRSAIDSL